MQLLTRCNYCKNKYSPVSGACSVQQERLYPFCNIGVYILLHTLCAKDREPNVLKWCMYDVGKLLLVFIAIMILLRKKLNIGLVMFLAASVLILLYKMPPDKIWDTCRRTVMNPVTLKLILALSFIRIFEMILREHRVLARMMDTVKTVFRNRKIVTISMPLLIGLMPSVGGAYFSAPMVAETTNDTRMSPEEKGFINYWFRHPWEYILPLYPGILLAAAITKIQLYDLILANSAYAALLVITGFMFAMHGLRGETVADRHMSARAVWSFAPIVAVLLLVMLFRIELHYSLIAVVLFLFFFYRYRAKNILATFSHGFSLDVIVLILGVMFFKEAMDNSGAVRNLSQFFLEKNIPVAPILFMLPFISGVLTGITVGFVGSTFPLLISLTENTSVAAISFAFASGLIGVLLSPVHVCLILTKEYFKADLWKMYRMMIPAGVIVFAGAVVQYLILK